MRHQKIGFRVFKIVEHCWKVRDKGVVTRKPR